MSLADAMAKTPAFVNRRGRIELDVRRHAVVGVITLEVRVPSQRKTENNMRRWMPVSTVQMASHPGMTERQVAKKYMVMISTLYGLPYDGYYALLAEKKGGVT